MATPFADYQAAYAPSWLQGPVGEAWHSAFGVMKDAVVEGAIQALKCRWVGVCPVDALAWIGAERGIAQLPTENLYAYRARLQSAWLIWKYAGTKTGVANAIQQLGYPNVTVAENGPYSVNPATRVVEWWRFTVFLQQPHPFSVSWFWGDGGGWGAPARVWGLGQRQAIADIVTQIRTWKPPHALCSGLVIILSGHVWNSQAPSFNWGDGTVYGAVVANVNM